jgi:hypothetical protein
VTVVTSRSVTSPSTSRGMRVVAIGRCSELRRGAAEKPAYAPMLSGHILREWLVKKVILTGPARR